MSHRSTPVSGQSPSVGRSPGQSSGRAFALVAAPVIAVVVVVALVLLRSGPMIYGIGILAAPLATVLYARHHNMSAERTTGLAVASTTVVLVVVAAYFIALLAAYDRVMDGF